MRQMLASILLLCLGVVLPVSGASRLICLMDPVAVEVADCCSGCQAPAGDSHDECCVKISELPDSPMPGPGCELPPMIVADLVGMESPTPRLLAGADAVCLKNQPIRGPTMPAAFRAVLGIWRI